MDRAPERPARLPPFGILEAPSGAANREVRAPLRLLVTHFFNHQTHHRGQVHAMLTAAGQETGDTDLFLLIPGIVG